MNRLTSSKAGPSQAQPQWTRKSSKWRGLVGSLIKALSIGAVLLLGYAAFTDSFLHKRQGWFWKFQGSQDDKPGQYGNSKGSRYLLGVGKADITG
jgi:hypothetical protein